MIVLQTNGRRNANRRRGGAVLEFAIVAPVLFLVFMGMVEIGRAVMGANLVANASREGARKAALASMNVSDVRTWTLQYLTASKIPTTNAVVSVYAETTAGAALTLVNDISNLPWGRGVAVKVEVPVSQLSWLGRSIFMSGSSKLSETTIMRRER